MILRTTAQALACVTLLFAGVAQAAPQIETPGFFLETIGPTINEIAESDKQYVEDPITEVSYFYGLSKVAAFAFAENVRVIVDGVLQALPVVDMRSQVSDFIDSGMGGVAIHPDFPAVKEILITYTHFAGVTPIADNQPKYARVARLNLREEVDATGNVSYFADQPTDNDVIVGKLKATPEFPSCNDRPLGADCLHRYWRRCWLLQA